jgi:hypothetical protein
VWATRNQQLADDIETAEARVVGLEALTERFWERKAGLGRLAHDRIVAL